MSGSLRTCTTIQPVEGSAQMLAQPWFTGQRREVVKAQKRVSAHARLVGLRLGLQGDVRKTIHTLGVSHVQLLLAACACRSLLALEGHGCIKYGFLEFAEQGLHIAAIDHSGLQIDLDLVARQGGGARSRLAQAHQIYVISGAVQMRFCMVAFRPPRAKIGRAERGGSLIGFVCHASWVLARTWTSLYLCSHNP